jgi:pimeloyl-ACP methyl ester carboxylesterase
MPGALRAKTNSTTGSLQFAILFVMAICAAGMKQAAAEQAPPNPAAAPITEEGYVRIGGIDQWIQIRGQHRDNPVVLWLNGGPGFSTIPATPLYSRWEQPFTVVMWDQRGEGKTFERSGRSVAASMTIAQMTKDGIEVAEYLRTRLGRNKIILLGHSWGSILGVHMVKQRPDLFSAYVGTGQVVQLSESATAAYPLLTEYAKLAPESVSMMWNKVIRTPATRPMSRAMSRAWAV